MNNIGEKYLPIGTVVMLKGASKRLMITGFCTMSAENKEEVFDYAGCMYPEGFLSSEQTALFNHEQIEKVYHMGLEDEEEKKFKNTLATILGNVNEKTKESEPTTTTKTDVPTLEMPIYNGQQNVNNETTSNF